MRRGGSEGKDRYSNGADVEGKSEIRRTENKPLKMILITYGDDKYLYIAFWRAGKVKLRGKGWF